MRISVEVDNRFLSDNENDREKRVYITFDDEGRKYLIDILSRPEWKRNGEMFKIMSEDWGPFNLSQEKYYDGTVLAEVLEFTFCGK